MSCCANIFSFGGLVFPPIKPLYVAIAQKCFHENCGITCLTGSPRRPLDRARRQPNKASRRRSNNGKDVLRRRHVECQGTVGSPVRRSQRLAGRRTPVGVSKTDTTVNHSGNTVIMRNDVRNYSKFCISIFMQIKHIFICNGLHEDSFSKEATGNSMC